MRAVSSKPQPTHMNKVLVKEGVVFKEFNEVLLRIIVALSDVFLRHGKTATITSCNDGKHMGTSYHYKNKALDIRIRDLPESMWKQYQNDLQTELGAGYQVILEKDHIHIEVA